MKRPIIRLSVGAAAMCAVLVTWVPPTAHAAASIDVHATLNGRDERSIDQNSPLHLNPDRLVRADLRITNRGTDPVTVRSANLNGRVMGLTFFSFETRLDWVLAPGVTESRMFGFELVGLKGQATGLLPAHLDVLDVHRHVMATQSFPTEVKGSITSVYGIFGLLVAAITALLFAGALIRLATHRLPANRWQRGARFGVPGIGLGLTLTFSLSAFRVLLPKPSSWLAIVVVCAVGMFVFGYITPTPENETDYDGDDDFDPDAVGYPAGEAWPAGVSN
jgi:hypothetical protein